MPERTGLDSDKAHIDRRSALLAVAVMGGVFVGVAHRRRKRPHTAEHVWPWSDVASWTVRLPEGVDAAALRDAGPQESPGAGEPPIFTRLPAAEHMQWTPEGVRTVADSRQVVGEFRRMITDDLSHGRIRLASGWVLADTEWILMQLGAAGRV